MQQEFSQAQDTALQDVTPQDGALCVNESSVSPIVRLALGFLATMAIACYLTERIYHPNLFGDIAIGRWIISHRQVPTVDLWTKAFNGNFWVSDGWLSDSLFAFIEKWQGFKGLVVVKLLFTCLYAGLLVAVCTSRARSLFIGMLFSIPAIAGVLNMASLGSELLGYSMLITCIWLAYFFLENSLSKPSNDKFSLLRSRWFLYSFAFLVCVLHANFDAQFVISVIVVGVLFCDDNFCNNKRQLSKVSRCALWLGSCAALFCTPYGYLGLYALGMRASALITNIAIQLNPGTFFDYSVGFLALLIIPFLIMWKDCPLCVRKSEAILVASFGLGAFAYVSCAYYALIITSIVCASVWGRANVVCNGDFGDVSDFAKGVLKLRAGMCSFASVASHGLVFFLLACCIVSIVSLVRFPLDRGAIVFAEADYLEHLNESKQNELFPLLNDPLIGGYLVYRFSDESGNPKHLVAFDERTSWINPELFYFAHDIDNLGKGFKLIFSEIAPNGAICSNGSALCELLDIDPKWEKVFGRSLSKDTSSQGIQAFSWNVYKKVVL